MGEVDGRGEDDGDNERSCGQFKMLSFSFVSSQAGFCLFPSIAKYCKRKN